MLRLYSIIKRVSACDKSKLFAFIGIRNFYFLEVLYG